MNSLLSEQFVTTTRIIDLGTADDRWRGIYAPAHYTDDVVTKFIHQPFLDESDTYLRKYQDQALWQHHLKNARQHFGSFPQENIKILDLGSGGGNTIFPLLHLYPGSKVVATDLSLPLLRSLRRGLDKLGTGHNCVTLQLNAEELLFEDSQFDLIVGAAILHHLFEPERSISEAFRVLKPGGAAVFFEPFEAGHQIVGRALKDIVKLSNEYQASGARSSLAHDVATALSYMWDEWDIRKGRDKSAAVFQRIDDKWLFTRLYLEEVGKQAGFRSVATYNLYSTEGLFSNHVETMLRLTVGKSLQDLPEWAGDYMRSLDQNFSPECLRDLIIEGGIVFTK